MERLERLAAHPAVTMNACFHLAHGMTQQEAERILCDEGNPECLNQAALYVLSQQPPEEQVKEEER